MSVMLGFEYAFSIILSSIVSLAGNKSNISAGQPRGQMTRTEKDHNRPSMQKNSPEVRQTGQG
jgi:hypothetical protein